MGETRKWSLKDPNPGTVIDPYTEFVDQRKRGSELCYLLELPQTLYELGSSGILFHPQNGDPVDVSFFLFDAGPAARMYKLPRLHGVPKMLLARRVTPPNVRERYLMFFERCEHDPRDLHFYALKRVAQIQRNLLRRGLVYDATKHNRIPRPREKGYFGVSVAGDEIVLDDMRCYVPALEQRRERMMGWLRGLAMAAGWFTPFATLDELIHDIQRFKPNLSDSEDE